MINLFKLKRKTNLDSRGDTIVEVLIAIAIVSLILAGAYNVSTRSLTSVRDAQEHNQALQIAQGQLEILDSKNGLDLDHFNCFDGNGNAQIKPGVPDQSCAFNSKNTNNCTTAGEPYCYNVTITEPVPHTYHVVVTWDKLGGGQNNVSMYYRLPLSTLTGASGAADIGNHCAVFPTAPECLPGPPPPPGTVLTAVCAGNVNNNTCYGWYMDVTNNSPVIQDPLVIGCSWNWGDGSPTTDNIACKHGESPPRHYYNTTNTYINAPPYANADAWMIANPWPSACLVGDIYAPYNITLTVHLSNSLNPVKTYSDYRLPWCDVAWL